MLLRVLAAFLLFIASAGSSLAVDASADTSIWGPVIMPQPFDREPFRAIRVPEWVRGTVGCGYTLSGMTSEQRERAAKAGVTIS
jgi:hypothetical protein